MRAPQTVPTGGGMAPSDGGRLALTRPTAAASAPLSLLGRAALVAHRLGKFSRWGDTHFHLETGSTDKKLEGGAPHTLHKTHPNLSHVGTFFQSLQNNTRQTAPRHITTCVSGGTRPTTRSTPNEIHCAGLPPAFPARRDGKNLPKKGEDGKKHTEKHSRRRSTKRLSSQKTVVVRGLGVWSWRRRLHQRYLAETSHL